MKIAITIAVALAAAAPALSQSPVVASRWERILIPPQSSPTAEQCVVVDADLYAHAAPGLRDVRLIQDGRELPYAMDVSFDTRVGEAAPPPADDRAQYEIAQTIPLLPQPAAGVAGQAGDKAVPETYFNETLLSAHVPVERVRLVPAPKSPAQLDLRAAARMTLNEAEELHATITPQRPAVPFTIGANLQQEADILVRVHQAGEPPRALILEMRRREICYQPRSASPIHLLLGDGDAEPARYEYALHFQPKAEPLLASMGPMRQNPSYRARQASAPLFHVTPALRLGVMLTITLGSLAVTAFAILELRRR